MEVDRVVVEDNAWVALIVDMFEEDAMFEDLYPDMLVDRDDAAVAANAHWEREVDKIWSEDDAWVSSLVYEFEADTVDEVSVWSNGTLDLDVDNILVFLGDTEEPATFAGDEVSVILDDSTGIVHLCGRLAVPLDLETAALRRRITHRSPP